jgi:hypothetical protein
MAMEATHMKTVQVIGTGALFLLLGVVAPAYTQEEAKPSKQEEAKPAKQEEKAKPAKQEEKTAPPKQEEKATPAKHEEKPAPARQEEKAQPAKQEEHAKAAPQDHPQQVQRTKQAEEKQRAEPALRLSVNAHSRIPDDRFRTSFGREHRFRIDSPRMVEGYSRFQYGGFWFGFVQPWPEDWYYTDDVYVDFVDGGYYLYNPSYPEARIEISVVL